VKKTKKNAMFHGEPQYGAEFHVAAVNPQKSTSGPQALPCYLTAKTKTADIYSIA
jgi:hypothetical protein